MMTLGGNMTAREEQEKHTRKRIVFYGKHHQEAMTMITVTTAYGYQIVEITLNGQEQAMVIKIGPARILIIKDGQDRIMMIKPGQAQIMTIQNGQAQIMTIQNGQAQKMTIQNGQGQIMTILHGQAQILMMMMALNLSTQTIVLVKDLILHRVNRHVKIESQTAGVQVFKNSTMSRRTGILSLIRFKLGQNWDV